MRSRRHGRARRRIISAFLLALAPTLLVGGLETHLGHGAGRADTPIFAEARHAGQTEHFDAAGTVRVGRCSDCLAPDQPPLAPQLRGARLIHLASGTAAARRVGGPRDPAAEGSRRPRAPPRSALS